VALTANALTGSAEMFMQNGFDGFLSKPVDPLKLDNILNKYIRDRHPQAPQFTEISDEDAQLTPEEGPTPQSQRQLIEAFRRDAESAAAALQKAAQEGDAKLFATAAHKLKAPLELIGEPELAQAAALLEKAGRDGDKIGMARCAAWFADALGGLVKQLPPPETDGLSDEDKQEDAAFLAEQMRIIKAACEDYDDTSAYAALDRLGERGWKKQTAKTIHDIRDDLFYNSDFESAAKRAAKLCG
jgi:HPt (histidine-containing phosphotransfer) domain-containing protein